MKVTIETAPTKDGNAVRGVGRYTADLLSALKQQQEIQISETVDQDTDVIHYPYFDLFFHTLPIRQKKKTIVTVHDVIPLLYPKQYPVGLRGRYNLFLQKMALSSVAKIVTVSDCSKQDIVQHLKIGADKIAVIPEYVSNRFAPADQHVITSVEQKYHLPQSFILYVGDINYNKNVPGLIDGFAKSGLPNVDLVLAGKAFSGPNIPELRVINGAIKASGMENRIHKIGFVTDVDLPALYSAATAYVQPSFYEGFGLPVLEAMACGTVVICAKTASLPEVAGDAVVYFNPADASSLAQALQKITTDDGYRSAMQQKGLKRAAQFSIAQFRHAMVALYQSLED